MLGELLEIGEVFFYSKRIQAFVVKRVAAVELLGSLIKLLLGAGDHRTDKQNTNS